LIIVKHSDFLEEKNLPIFNGRAIEINMHRIPNLREHFVYFNDDMFMLEPMLPVHFFKDGLPVDIAICDIMYQGEISHTVMNDIDIINKHYNRHISKQHTKRAIIKRNFLKWFNLDYGIAQVKTLLLLHWNTFTGFINYHHPQPFLKKTFVELWQKELEILEKTSASKFKSVLDVNPYLFRYWQLVKGDFAPGDFKDMYKKRKHAEIRVLQDAQKVANEIANGEFQMYCINDGTSKGRFNHKEMSEEDFNHSKKLILEALESKLPQKSRFEL
jgi:hypothetical protein